MAGKKRVISHRDFVRDLGRGAKGEAVVEAFFEEEFGLVAKNVSENNPDYDLILDEVVPELLKKPKVVPKKLLKKIFKDAFSITRKDSLTVEVKLDEAAARYGNFFFEIFLNVETGSPGGIFKCKADLFVWVVPGKRRKYNIYLFKRAEMMAWLFDYVLTYRKKLTYKTPGISPYARGLPISIEEISDSPACLGVFDYKI